MHRRSARGALRPESRSGSLRDSTACKPRRHPAAFITACLCAEGRMATQSLTWPRSASINQSRSETILNQVLVSAARCRFAIHPNR